MTYAPLASAMRGGRWAGYVLMILLAVVVAVSSIRYLLPGAPGAADIMLGHLALRPIAFLTHVVCGMAALLLGAPQFVTRLGRRRMWHAAAGRVYVLACLAGGATGLIIAWFSEAGPVATAGFSALAVAWLITTGMGWREIVAGRVAAHRRWMVRSYAVTLAAVSLRLMLPAMEAIGIDFIDGYRVLSFLCWIPNLALAEVWIRAGARRRLPGLPAGAA